VAGGLAQDVWVLARRIYHFDGRRGTEKRYRLVNTGKRDSKDTSLNRLTLRIQYRLAGHIFVHTERMRIELIEEYGVQGTRIMPHSVWNQ
jgi:hypothetical protein